jgi:molybdate transport system substrate-binding protein
MSSSPRAAVAHKKGARRNMGMEITVMSSGSAEPGLDFVAAAFREKTGHAVRIVYNTGAKGKQYLQDGGVDVVIATINAMDRMFRPAGLVETGGICIGRAGIGITVRPGAPVPDVSSAAALKHALVETQSLLITTETSGLYIEDMLKKMQIYEQLQARITHCHSAPDLIDRLLSGVGNEIGVLPINAIRSHMEKGAVLAGPLPEEVQFYREFMAVPTTNSTHKEVAREFVRFCGGPGKSLFVANGFN